MKRRATILAAGLAALLASAAPAAAAERHASPNGSGTKCTRAEPCSLAQAIVKAADGDEIILAGGEYQVAEPLVSVAPNLHIHGDFEGPMPRVRTSTFTAPINVISPGSRLSHLDIEITATGPIGAFCPPGGRVDRVRVAAVGTIGARGMTLYNGCEIRDSLIIADAPGAVAIGTDASVGTVTGVVRNVTALADGDGSAGISAQADPLLPGDIAIDLKNVIASGRTADLVSRGGLLGAAHVTVTNSNFDTLVKEGSKSTVTENANQTAPPLFVDAAAGDYRQAAGSPTIDAGSFDGIGQLDLGGNPRVLGPAPDIGAYEFVPAPPPPAPEPVLSSLAISPRGFRPVNAGGAIVSARRKRAPVGARVAYGLNVAASVRFRVERVLGGRRVGGRCVKPSAANRKRRRCARRVPVKGSFEHAGAAGANSFRFSGRLGRKALRPGRYRLVGEVGSSTRAAGFTIVAR